METRYKHIHFKEELHRSRKKPAYVCYNNKMGEELGYVEYYPQWKRYVFEGIEGRVFDASCLKDIIHFIEQALKENPNG